MRGACGVIPRASSTTGANSGSIIREWKAWEVWSWRQTMPFAARLSASRATAVGSPATTDCSGPLTAARERSSPRSSSTLSSGSGTASMAPAGSSSIIRARFATSARASSRESTPATQAAAYSPTL